MTYTIRFFNGKTPVVRSYSGPDGAELQMGEPYGSPSRGYRSRVYQDKKEVGYAINYMDGKGWQVTVDPASVEAKYKNRLEQKEQFARIFDAVQQQFPEWEFKKPQCDTRTGECFFVCPQRQATVIVEANQPSVATINWWDKQQEVVDLLTPRPKRV